MKAMAEPSRLTILQFLCDGEKNVTELVSRTGFSQASVSKHLRILRIEELVDSRRDNRMVYYRLKSMMPKEVCDRICHSLEENIVSGKKRIKNYWSAINE